MTLTDREAVGKFLWESQGPGFSSWTALGNTTRKRFRRRADELLTLLRERGWKEPE